MPIQPSYPGVYVQEVPSGVRTITGVSTSVAAFIGYARRGPMNEPVQLFNFGDFEREFGGLDSDSEISYAIQQFFLNGGTEAHVVRTAKNASTAGLEVVRSDGSRVMTMHAANPGTWGNDLRVEIDYDTRDPNNQNLFNLRVGEYPTPGGEAVRTETFRNLSLLSSSSRFVASVIEDASGLLEVEVPDAIQEEARQAEASSQNLPRPPAHEPYKVGQQPSGTDPYNRISEGRDGEPPEAQHLEGSRSDKTGIYALEKVDLFNLLSIPRTAELDDTGAKAVIAEALSYCEEERAFMIVDVPNEAKFRGTGSVTEIKDWVEKMGIRHDHAALYFPRVRVADPLDEYRPRSIAASGTLAGLYARTDTERGVWKAPAGTNAGLRGVHSLDYKMSDAENGTLNPLGINALRSFPVYGTVSWGGRTLEGADRLADEYKYIPVRRTALYIEESLYRGLQWVVFEPNDETLWSQIRMNVKSFMQNLFQEGAFQGTSASEAYFVKCDGETTTQYDINRGVVNIVVGFAPLKPAEFVILKIQQMAGQEQ